ncbi:MAG: tRNA lysidine(34) synthetase TilS [Oscillospiraceae bacterium]|nr:tRNA lysidine(34) synthetase TilS [Oscillospiraceae bacterium]
MTDKVIETVKKHNMISRGDKIGVGVSGGADSVSLLHFLVKNKTALGVESITAVHVNHKIRGEEADRDMLFTKKLCEALGVAFEAVTVDVPKEAEKTGESLETCARRLRYAVFESFGFDKFATAHNLNDRMETFFFNLSRGASASGLLSIPYVRGNYIRPLLDTTRAEIEEYLTENGLTYITDSTNNCDDYTRNRIRHFLIPQMFELNPSFQRAFLKCESSLESENAYIKEETEKLLNGCRKDNVYYIEKLKNAHEVLRFRAISKILKEQSVNDISREHIELLDRIILHGGKASVSGNTARCERGVLSFGEAENIPDFCVFVNDFTDSVKTPCGDFKILNFSKKDLQNIHKHTFNNLIDCDKIIGCLKIRSRIPGESVKLYKRKVTKTLKGLFNEKKIPVSLRRKIAVLADDEGIVWLEGFGVSERCAVSNDTDRAIEFTRIGDLNEK